MKFNRMNQVDIHPNMTTHELLNSMKDGGFTCRKVALAMELLVQMIHEKKCKIFLGLAGALIPGGMRKIIRKMIEKDMVDCIVTTGANISHDLLETSGGSHHHGSEYLNDEKLMEMKILRPNLLNTFPPCTMQWETVIISQGIMREH